MLRSLLLLALLGAVSVNAALFSQLPAAPWAPRILQGWAFPTQPVTYTPNGGSSTTAAAGSAILVWGGQLYNDTYISTDKGNSWTLIGGIGAAQNSAGALVYTTSTGHPATFTADSTGACKRYDPVKNEYYVFDKTRAFWSNNGLDWTTATSDEYAGRTSSTCFVGPDSTVFLVGGQNTTSSAYENDVWSSSTQASSFTRVGLGPFSQRDSMSGYGSVQPLGKAVITAIGGHAKVEDIRPNEVWISSDNAASWTLLTKAPFAGRDHFTSLVTSNNIQVVVAGKVDGLTSTGNALGVNDVWASLDGGATWGQCTDKAEFAVRQDSTLAIDSDGYLYVSGGTSNPMSGGSTRLNDVWRSTMSFTNVNAVVSQCGLSTPQCAIGLRCWPNATSYTMGSVNGSTYPIPTAASYNCPCVSPNNNNNNGAGMVNAQGWSLGLVMLVLSIVMVWM